MIWESVKRVKKSKADYKASGHCIIKIVLSTILGGELFWTLDFSII